MNPQTAFGVRLAAFFLIVGSITALSIYNFRSSAAISGIAEIPADFGNYDIRTDLEKPSRNLIELFLSQSQKDAPSIGADRERSIRAGAELERRFDRIRIARNSRQFPEIIELIPGKNDPPLGFAGSTRRAEVLRRFVNENADFFGIGSDQTAALDVTSDYVNPDGNLAFASLAQRVNGIPVFQSEIKAAFSKRGEMFRVINNLAPDIDAGLVAKDFGSPEKAISDAAKLAGFEIAIDRPIDAVPPSATGTEFRAVLPKGAAIAEKIYFPIDSGLARPAWKVLLQSEARGFYVIVDAASGALLWRKDLIEHQTQPATFSVYGNNTSMTKTADGPAAYTPGCASPLACPEQSLAPRQSFTLIGNEPPYQFNNLGWINDGENRTLGNNIEAGIDRDGINGIDPNGHAVGNPPRNFVFEFNPAPGNPPPGDEPINTVFQMGSVTHAFYMANRWHDETYRLGFTEQALNFQTDNFGRGGLGNDSISVEIQDSSGTSGANFFTPADGSRPRLQLFIWATPTPDRDGGLDSQVGFHELTHGLSNRLHANTTGLITNMARGMGEGWSDFYALALLAEPTDDPSGIYAVGGYSLFGITPTHASYYYGVRRFPYAIKSSVGPNGRPHNPLTFRYLNSDCSSLIGTATENPNSAFPRGFIGASSPCDQTHNMGEVWAAALWEVRNELITRHGAVEGNRRALQYVTDGMKLSPIGPNMIHSRDAIISAATISDAADELPVRRGFAIRGLGYFASIQNTGTGNNNTVVTESFVAVGNALIGNGFAVSDQPGNNNGFPESGENVRITLPLTNPTATALTGVSATFGGQTATYGDIAPGQTVSRTIDGQIPISASCGQLFNLEFGISSNVGQATEGRPVRIGVPVTGAPSVFASQTAVTINMEGPATPYGTSIDVSGLSGRKTITLELNGLSHVFPSDIDMLLVGPNGQSFVPMSDSGGGTPQSNITVRLYDDASDLLPAGAAQLAGDWKPTNNGTPDNFPAPAPTPPYNSPVPTGTATFGSVFGDDGSNLNGTWTLYVFDDIFADAGSMAGWKLRFESADYVCAARPARNDFDGDGRTDISVFRPSDGVWYVNGSTSGFGAVRWGMSDDMPAPGDYDGDGKADFVVFRPNSDTALPDFYLLRSSDFTYHGLSWGLAGDKPVMGDFNADARMDFAVYRPSSGVLYVHPGDGGAPIVHSATPSAMAFAFNHDGDGRADFATFVDGVWRISTSMSGYQSTVTVNWGLAGDLPVSADYDGDGRDDLAVFRPSNRTWYIQNSGGGHVFAEFGLATDVPVPGDYDGDGKNDIAVFRDGLWFINRSTSGMLIASFGLAGDKPLPNSYLP